MRASSWLYLIPYDEDTDRAFGPEAPDGVRRLGDDELLAHLGTTRPSREEFLAQYKNPDSSFPPDAGAGGFTTLYGPDGEPQELVFWGSSED